MSEQTLQAQLVQWIDVTYRGELIYSIGLEGTPLPLYLAKKMKSQGMKPGWPDLRLYAPNGKHMLLELKYGDNDLTKSQKELHEWLNENGHTVKTAYSYEQAKTIIVDFYSPTLPSTVWV